MKNTLALKAVSIVIAMFFMLQLTGCGQMITAIEHSDMQVKLKMTDTIFLDPVAKAKNKSVYVVVNNTSDMQEVDTGMLQNLISSRLTAKGYQVVSDPSQAGYIIQANVLYMDYYRETGTHEGALEGGLAGAGAGALLGQSRDTSIALGLIGGLVGGIGGALIGKALKVETYAGDKHQLADL
ncbi:MAG: complement resistance protein TraT [Dictyoglomus turgidum]